MLMMLVWLVWIASLCDSSALPDAGSAFLGVALLALMMYKFSLATFRDLQFTRIFAAMLMEAYSISDYTGELQK